MPYTPTSQDGYVGLFLVPNPEVPVAHVNLGASSFQVSEKIISSGNLITSIAEADLTLFVHSGTISTVVLEKRKSAQKSTNTLYFPKTADASWWAALNTKYIRISYDSVDEDFVFGVDISIPAPSTNRIIQLMENVRDTINAESNFVIAKLIGPSAMRLISKTGGVEYNAGLVVSSTEVYITPKNSIFSGGVDADTVWIHAATCQVAQETGTNWIAGQDYTKEFDIPGIEFSSIGIDWDFRARFFNTSMQEALTHTEVYTVARLEDTNVTFNGINDIDEYAEVTGLTCTNAGADGGEGGGGNNNVVILTGDIVMLVWDNMGSSHNDLINHPLGRTIDSSHIASSVYCNPNGEDINSSDVTVSGVQLHQKLISRTQLACLDHYAIFTFISSGIESNLDPCRDWPTDDEPYGDWSLVGITSSTSMSVPLAQTKYMSFWVGFATFNTFDNGGTHPPFNAIYQDE